MRPRNANGPGGTGPSGKTKLLGSSEYTACATCGILFWPLHRSDTHCGECFRWRRAGELIAISARLLRGAT